MSTTSSGSTRMHDKDGKGNLGVAYMDLHCSAHRWTFIPIPGGKDTKSIDGIVECPSPIKVQVKATDSRRFGVRSHVIRYDIEAAWKRNWGAILQEDPGAVIVFCVIVLTKPLDQCLDIAQGVTNGHMSGHWVQVDAAALKGKSLAVPQSNILDSQVYAKWHKLYLQRNTSGYGLPKGGN